MKILEVHAADFLSADEKGQPVVIRGGCKQWPAYQQWKGYDGEEYLSGVCGDAPVEVMCSQDGNFHGDISGRKIESCTFRDFLSEPDSSEELYLAQNPIRSSDGRPGPLQALQADIITPPFLEEREISSVNLWMSRRSSRSSLHYDPFQNLLCVVTGSKAVQIFSPAATPFLYPLPFWGESSNHSAVNFAELDLEKHPNYTRAMDHMGSVGLQAGDMLFLPEGFWHQVVSAPGTIAVNFWWQSASAHILEGPPDQYLLRRLLQSAVQAKKEEIMAEIIPIQVRHRFQGLPPHNAEMSLEEESQACIQRLALCPAPDQCGCPKYDQNQRPATQPAKRARKVAQAERLPMPASSHVGSTSGDVGRARMAQLEAMDSKHQIFCTRITDAKTLGMWSPSESEGNPEWATAGPFDKEAVAAACARCWGRLVPEHAALISPYEPLIHIAHRLHAGSDAGADNDDKVGVTNLATIVLAALTPEEVTHLMLFLVRHFPSIAGAMLKGALVPCAAELLTRRFEEADAQCKDAQDQEARQNFYSELYSVVEDKAAVMRKLVQLKEEVAKEAARRVKQEQWTGDLGDARVITRIVYSGSRPR